MELTARYGLEFNPFLKNSKEILYAGSEYKEALFRLDYLSKTKGFGLLTGAPGRGKTTLVRNWCEKLNPSLFKVIYTSLSTVTVNDFYRNLAVSLGAQAAYRKTENFHAIQGEITRLALDKKKTPVIIIDEANYVSNAVLNDLKILFNFEMDSRDRAVILLVGGAGCHHPVFEEEAIEAILNAADGTARMVSKLCNASLVIGNSRSLSLITADTVMQAINDSTIG